MSPDLTSGCCYVIWGRESDHAYEQFRRVLARPLPGLVITRTYPDRIREEFGLQTAKILWLSPARGDSHLPPSPNAISSAIRGFVDGHNGEAAVMFDGVEYLIVKTGFLKTFVLIEHVSEFVKQRKVVVLIPLSPDAISDTERGLFKRNLKEVVAPEAMDRGPSPILSLVLREGKDWAHCDRLRDRLSRLGGTVVEGPQGTFQERIRRAEAKRIPFIVLVGGAELDTGILHVILWTGLEKWLSFAMLEAMVRDWKAGRERLGGDETGR
jgi:hypothetical protein